MKQFYSFLLFVSLTPLSSGAQKLEIRAHLTSGFYSYRGDGAESISQIISTTSTNNPYGSKGGLSYGLSLDLRKVTKHRLILGADLGYEMLRSKVDLKYTDVIGDIASSFEGRTYLNNSFINLFPYLGGRFTINKQNFDLIGGLDLGYLLSSREKGDARSVDNAGFHIETSEDRLSVRTDFRPRIQLSTDFDKIGIYVGYSHGLRNYKANLIGLDTHVYSRMWRVGLSYRLM